MLHQGYQLAAHVLDGCVHQRDLEFTGRGTESAEVMERRLAVAREELAAAGEFEVTLVNTSVQDVCRQLVALMKH